MRKGLIDSIFWCKFVSTIERDDILYVHARGDDHTSVRVDSISFTYIAMFCKVYLSGEEEYIPHLYGEYAQQDIDEGLIELVYDISEGRAEFEVSNLVIDPVSVDVGKSVTVSVDIVNSGTKSGKHMVRLMIDGARAQGKRTSNTRLFAMVNRSVYSYFLFTSQEMM